MLAPGFLFAAAGAMLYAFPGWWGGLGAVALFYAFIWSVADPILLGCSGAGLSRGALQCEVGARESVSVPLDAIALVEKLASGAPLPAGTWSANPSGSKPNVLIHLHPDGAVSHRRFDFALPAEQSRSVRALALALQRPDEFVATLDSVASREQVAGEG